jgi:hypothetical protein
LPPVDETRAAGPQFVIFFNKKTQNGASRRLRKTDHFVASADLSDSRVAFSCRSRVAGRWPIDDSPIPDRRSRKKSSPRLDTIVWITPQGNKFVVLRRAQGESSILRRTTLRLAKGRHRRKGDLVGADGLWIPGSGLLATNLKPGVWSRQLMAEF